MIINSYSELKFYIEMFKNGNADLLIIESAGGLGKTSIVEEIMKDQDYLRILAHTTSLKLFIEAYKNRGKPLIFDDVDSLLKDEDTVSILKMICNTEEIKEVCWFTTSPILVNEGVPYRYETKSKAIIICNDFKILTEKIAALADRGWYLQFAPTNAEILNKIKEIMPKVFQDMTTEEKEKIYNVLEEYSLFCDITLRTFIKGLSLYRECNHGKNLDWKSKLLQSLELNPKMILLDKLIREFNNDLERISQWEKLGYSKRSFYDYKAKLNAKTQSVLNNVTFS